MAMASSVVSCAGPRLRWERLHGVQERRGQLWSRGIAAQILCMAPANTPVAGNQRRMKFECAQSCVGNRGCSVVVSRRIATLLSGLLLTATFEDAMAEEVQAPSLSLELYEDKEEGFTLLRPADWNKVDKAGATLLFEDPVTKSNSVGVVVNPVRIASLKDFGTPEQVADKLIRAEKNKGSTNDAKLLRVQERQVNGGPLYEVEYLLDSSRGQKRVLSAVTIASRKLYVLNVFYNDAPSQPISQDLEDWLQRILSSFNLLG